MYFSGTVTGVKFRSDTMYILLVRLDDGSEVTAKGHVLGLTLKEGVWLGFDGHWETHPKYGRQIAIDKAPRAPEGLWTTSMCSSMLLSSGLPDIVVRVLVDTFGENLPLALSDLRKLRKETLFSETEIAHIQKTWVKTCGVFETMDRLEDAGFSKYAMRQMWARFDNLQDLLVEDPWRLLEIKGVTLQQVDSLAERFALSMTSPGRVRGLILETIRNSATGGNTFAPATEVVSRVLSAMPDSTATDISKSLVAAHGESLLVLDQKTRPGLTAIYAPWLHIVETTSAELLQERLQQAKPSQTLPVIKGKEIEIQVPQTPEEWKSLVLETAGTKMVLSAEQLHGAYLALTAPVCVITGLPGTGKTTLLRVVSQMLVDHGNKVLLVAPTGIAAKRMQSVTGLQAKTIHRAFGAKSKASELEALAAATYGGTVIDDDDTSEQEELTDWLYNKDRPHEADVVFVDEASMVDAHLLYRILIATKPTCRLVFIGDTAQLPSVGPGNVLSDLISAGCFPAVFLKEVFRQQEQSGIIRASHAIVKGDLPALDEVAKDFVFIPLQKEEEILDGLLQLVQALFQAKKEFQVLSPRHNGTLGVTNLNECIRGRLNPKNPSLSEVKIGTRLLRQGDRIMVSKNDYKLDVFNGDVGKVVSIDRNRHVEVTLYGATAVHHMIPMDRVHLLKLAYAMTVHKSQGQEYDHIVLPWVRGFSPQLERNLLYTGITRAKKKVIILGHLAALEQAARTARTQVRNTLLVERIGADGICRQANREPHEEDPGTQGGGDKVTSNLGR